MRIICFDHITTATTPLPNRYLMKRTSYNHKVIYIPYTRVEVNTGIIKAYSSKKKEYQCDVNTFLIFINDK